jgi:hypothetical protein
MRLGFTDERNRAAAGKRIAASELKYRAQTFHAKKPKETLHASQIWKTTHHPRRWPVRTTADQYEAQLLGMLAGLGATQTGHAILNAFLHYQKDVLIYPYDGRLGKYNATTYEDWGLFGTKVSFPPSMLPTRAGNTPDIRPTRS